MNDVLVASYGGGVNSTAMLIGMQERGEIPNLIMFADTGGEKPETYAYLQRFEASENHHITSRLCPACDRGEKTTTPPRSSIVGSGPVHMPSGNICTRGMSEQMWAIYQIQYGKFGGNR